MSSSIQYTITIPTSLVSKFIKQTTLPLPKIDTKIDTNTSSTSTSSSSFTYTPRSTTRDYILSPNGSITPVLNSIVVRRNFTQINTDQINTEGKGVQGTVKSGYNRVKQVPGLRKRWRSIGDTSTYTSTANSTANSTTNSTTNTASAVKEEKDEKKKRKRSEEKKEKKKSKKAKK
mmetsp:Transcript_22693/g.42660  ORF Transcript_22693/g.42660 Transcript_22693/m.42660 type:complete len:175 (-) Transcript_22693:12-536(-)|eukprot:CAMPEP_0182495556 /NCGR_PEP_ID=MMETSP1321-20130603/4336_1 /TAXON_ID=91990 /ORGANISM="Bolidomonas sp., Strain RCC1657" /LENGTH=174 /DNA_ID=CAMNT_0024698975 /DNA_START=76 /DNA_END=600 /DNA_ORIENTATION=-